MARLYDFEQAYGAWFLESPECIVVLELQKSYFGNYYELNIKSFVQGAFGNHYVKSKDLAKKYMGNCFGRQPSEYNDIFDLEEDMEDEYRKERLEYFFKNFLAPLLPKLLSLSDLSKLPEYGDIFIPSAVKNEILRLSKK
ncbi:MAG TPA: hypothetical protein DEQ93_01430 [Odoribacter splanchnicus]|nr:hypothetical protein [Odoribacter splanchnicus]MBV4293057.1 hypothetical protein [Odoribacter splanchnicus]MBV4402453.1 hypothetical protein [Odoribacter splanchnicus]MBV4411109.1 hypothetical protein [Odoribacter splanchnicus]NUN82761.1 hypothetical protein [Odoribacter splanchnicus]